MGGRLIFLNDGTTKTEIRRATHRLRATPFCRPDIFDNTRIAFRLTLHSTKKTSTTHSTSHLQRQRTIFCENGAKNGYPRTTNTLKHLHRWGAIVKKLSDFSGAEVFFHIIDCLHIYTKLTTKYFLSFCDNSKIILPVWKIVVFLRCLS